MKPPTKEEIGALRHEARERLRTVAKASKLATIGRRKVAAFETLMEAFIEHRAVQLETSADNLALQDVFVSDDERALFRLSAVATIEASSAESIAKSIKESDTIDRVIARLAAERGWSPMDAARAILGDAGAKADAVRGSAPHLKARRVRQAVDQAVRAQLERVQGQLWAPDGGEPMDAAPTIVIGALIKVFTGRDLDLDDMRRMLHAERVRLTAALEQRRARTKSSIGRPRAAPARPRTRRSRRRPS